MKVMSMFLYLKLLPPNPKKPKDLNTSPILLSSNNELYARPRMKSPKNFFLPGRFYFYDGEGKKKMARYYIYYRDYEKPPIEQLIADFFKGLGWERTREYGTNLGQKITLPLMMGQNTVPIVLEGSDWDTLHQWASQDGYLFADLRVAESPVKEYIPRTFLGYRFPRWLPGLIADRPIRANYELTLMPKGAGTGNYSTPDEEERVTRVSGLPVGLGNKLDDVYNLLMKDTTRPPIAVLKARGVSSYI